VTGQKIRTTQTDGATARAVRQKFCKVKRPSHVYNDSVGTGADPAFSPGKDQTTMRNLLTTAFVLALTGVAAPLALAQDKDKDGFTPLFNGKDFTGWQTIVAGKDTDPAKVWAIKDGVIQTISTPNGYFYTDKSYKNFVLRYDWMYPQDQPKNSSMNSGLLLHIQGQHKVWPKCIEAQGRLMDHGKVFALGGAKASDVKFNADAHKTAVKPQGEWNTTEVTAKSDGTIIVKINGIEVASCKSDLVEGPFGFQAEGAYIHFKNIRLKSLD
jgi:hypothetical protein